jgi:hypothetical protein
MKKLLSAAAVLVLTGAAYATPAKYDYRCYPNDKTLSTVDLELQGRKATLNGDDTGSYDSSYTGGDSAKFDRFVGFNSEDGQVELLVQKSLRKGAGKGEIRIQVRGEGFSSDVYECYSR